MLEAPTLWAKRRHGGREKGRIVPSPFTAKHFTKSIFTDMGEMSKLNKSRTG